MSGHIFISYSHRTDGKYVDQLANHLTALGFDVWHDKEIIHGDRWSRVIRERIDTCTVFIVVMTPEAEDSEWVEREINEAIEAHRPILTLLLRGKRFFTLSTTQYDDVTGGHMPSQAFIDHLATLATRRATPSRQEIDDLNRRHTQAVRIGEAGDREEAVRLLRGIVTDRARVLGPDHPILC